MQSLSRLTAFRLRSLAPLQCRREQRYDRRHSAHSLHLHNKRPYCSTTNLNAESRPSPLDDIETTVQNVLQQYGVDTSLESIPEAERQAVGVARHLHKRLSALNRNGDCQTCWLQQAHCICSRTVPVERSVANLQRLYVLYHHKEIGLAVDTSKLLWPTLPIDQVRIVVGGIPAQYQYAMEELQRIVRQNNTIVLFPDDDAVTWKEFQQRNKTNKKATTTTEPAPASENIMADVGDNVSYNVIVLDGTWEQARKLYKRYIPESAAGGPIRIQLEQDDLDSIVSETGRQLRRHPIVWREIGTIAAVRRLLQSMDIRGPWNDVLTRYQELGDAATRTQLGRREQR